jgi:hypothetical protein
VGVGVRDGVGGGEVEVGVKPSAEPVAVVGWPNRNVRASSVAIVRWTKPAIVSIRAFVMSLSFSKKFLSVQAL